MPDNTTILSTLFKDKLFRVPDYQRGYAWSTQNWQDLIDDVELLENNNEKHYTGTLVIDYKEEIPDSVDEDANIYKTYDIVDGQQRLTTISILMNEIANELLLYDDSKKMAVGIKKNYIYTIIDGITVPKLALNSEVRQFYIDNIISSKPSLHGPEILSENRLLEARQYFKQYLINKKSELGDEYCEWLKSFMFPRVAQSLIFIVYIVPSVTDVGVIFETMNNRGKPLTEMEKVKNYLLYLASKMGEYGGEKLGEEINSTWHFLFKNLMLSKLFDWYEDNLLRTSWLMAYNFRPKEWDAVNSIKQQFNLKKYKGERKKLRDDIYKYIGILKDCCKAYCDILTPDNNSFSNYSNSNVRWDIIEISQKIVRMNATASFIPLLMAVRIKYSDKPDVYYRIACLCEKYAFRVYRLEEKRANAGQTKLYHMAFDLYNDSENAENIENTIVALLFEYASQDDFDNELDKLNQDWYNWYGLKYMLYEYELSLNKKVPQGMSWGYLHDKKTSASTIEHILPQTPSRTWKTKWKASERTAALNDIGNLVLTFDNSVYSNKSFEDKKGTAGHFKCYAGSPLASEIELAAYDDWTYSTYLERRNKIVAWAKNRWRLPSPTVKVNIEIEEE